MSRYVCHCLLASLAILGTSGFPVSKRGPTNQGPIPEYALKYAPYSYLHSTEKWWPSDVAIHVKHVTPKINFKKVADNVTLESLSMLDADVFLTSKDNVERNPDWLLAAYGKPKGSSGHSDAPATIIASSKAGGILDVFYFGFYSYNRGGNVLEQPVGNHVSDWEYTMVRFVDEEPKYIYLSAHGAGGAYTYDAMNKTGSRATTYIAAGTHANYATTGLHNRVGPFLEDYTDAGHFWDVTANYRGFWYDNDTETFTSAGGASTGSTQQATEGVNWLSWLGRWGDEKYPMSDHRQFCVPFVHDACRYESGSTGPIAKHLGRTDICQKDGTCNILSSL